MSRAYREGAHLAPRQAVGTTTVEQYREQVAAGTLPYADAIRSSLGRAPRTKAP